MSLLIKGVEMPDSCLNCRFRTTILKNVLSPTMRTSAYACLINGMEVDTWYEEKHKDCPLVEIPTPHGRLIDEEAIYNNVKSRCNNCHIRACAICGVTCILNDIRTAPTIIEAEVSE